MAKRFNEKNRHPHWMLVTSGILSIMAVSCSGLSTFQKGSKNEVGSSKNRGAPVVAAPSASGAEANGAGGEGSASSQDTTNDTELPPVDVAGVHLTSECEAPEKSLTDPKLSELECIITANSEQTNALRFDAVSLQDTASGESFLPISVTGQAGQDNNEYNISKSTVMTVRFEIEKSVLAKLKNGKAKIQFTNFVFNGQIRAAKTQLDGQIFESFPVVYIKTGPSAAELASGEPPELKFYRIGASAVVEGANTLSNDNYRFDGWSEELPTFVNRVCRAPGSVLKITSTTTLYPCWTKLL